MKIILNFLKEKIKIISFLFFLILMFLLFHFFAEDQSKFADSIKLRDAISECPQVKLSIEKHYSCRGNSSCDKPITIGELNDMVRKCSELDKKHNAIVDQKSVI